MSGAIFSVKKNKLFEKICCFKQQNLKNYLVQKLGMEKGDGWCYRQGTFPVLLTAHMDTVHKLQCNKVKYEIGAKGETIVSSNVGIGGDDRCGIYMILRILERVDCSVLFCEDEEIGSVGAGKFVKTDLCKSLKGKFKYIIELDRAHNNDAVFYDDDNEAFHKFVTEEFWKEDFGSWSDICTLSPELEISSVNLSCGYYRAHTTSEYVVLEEMERSIEETIKLLDRTDVNAKPFEYIERIKYYGNNWWHGLYDNYNYSDHYSYFGSYKEKETVEDDYEPYVVMEVVTVNGDYLMTSGESENECWANLFMENPTLCWNDVCDYYFC